MRRGTVYIKSHPKFGYVSRERAMPSSAAPAITPGKAIPINEVAAATGISVRKINRLIDDAVLPGYVCVKDGKRRAHGRLWRFRWCEAEQEHAP